MHVTKSILHISLRNTIACIAMLSMTFACKQGKHAKTKSLFTVKIAVDSSIRQYLDWPMIGNKFEDSVYYDSINKRTISVFDSLPKGSLDLTVFSMLSKDFTSSIDLQSDTLISITEPDYYPFKMTGYGDVLKLSLDKSDSMVFGRHVSGCFISYSEKLAINKAGNVYEISYSQNAFPMPIKRVISAQVFLKSFEKLQQSCIELFPKPVKGMMTYFYSTTQINTYLRKENVIYRIPEHSEWKGFDTFKFELGLGNLPSFQTLDGETASF